MTKTITRSKLLALINSTRGRFFSVIFVKKDGSMRRLTGRIGVRSHLRTDHRKSTTENYSLPYVCVWDTQKKAYRNVNLDTVTDIRLNNQNFIIEQKGIYMEFISTLGINGIDVILFSILIMVHHRKSIWKKRYSGLVDSFLTQK